MDLGTGRNCNLFNIVPWAFLRLNVCLSRMLTKVLVRLFVPHVFQRHVRHGSDSSLCWLTLVFLQHAQIFRLLLKIAVEENNWMSLFTNLLSPCLTAGLLTNAGENFDRPRPNHMHSISVFWCHPCVRPCKGQFPIPSVSIGKIYSCSLT